MGKTVATSVVLVSVNHLTDEQVEEFTGEGVELQDVADEMSPAVGSILREGVFADADEMPIFDIDSTVYDTWNGEDADELVKREE